MQEQQQQPHAHIPQSIHCFIWIHAPTSFCKQRKLILVPTFKTKVALRIVSLCRGRHFLLLYHQLDQPTHFPSSMGDAHNRLFGTQTKAKIVVLPPESFATFTPGSEQIAAPSTVTSVTAKDNNGPRHDPGVQSLKNVDRATVQSTINVGIR
jgi:hypothetical protein